MYWISSVAMPRGVEEGLAIQAAAEDMEVVEGEGEGEGEGADQELPSRSMVVLETGQKVEGGAEKEN